MYILFFISIHLSYIYSDIYQTFQTFIQTFQTFQMSDEEKYNPKKIIIIFLFDHKIFILYFILSLKIFLLRLRHQTFIQTFIRHFRHLY
jgi:hypothetical protein